MARRILIDAQHSEEVRVVLENNGRLEEFDFENSANRPIKGNVYLGKITRVEPSLQAVFVEYGGNRQGFLPFSEVHYDYYQIPVSDKEKLAELDKGGSIDDDDESSEEISSAKKSDSKTSKTNSKNDSKSKEEDGDKKSDVKAAEAKSGDAKTKVELDGDGNPIEKPKSRGRPKKADADKVAAKTTSDPKKKSEVKKAVSTKKSSDEDEGGKKTEVKKKPAKNAEASKNNSVTDDAKEVTEEDTPENSDNKKVTKASGSRRSPRKKDDNPKQKSADENDIEEDSDSVSNKEKLSDAISDAEEDAGEVRANRSQFYRKYKIQEVLKRGQLVLVQVIKEERGNKGASLTTYVSLPGRYCVLMPNTGRGGGVSRRISDQNDRKRLKQVVSNFNVVQGSSLIIRTAGVGQDAKEIQSDYDYLQSLWDGIKQKAVSSTAPALILEEGDIVRRSLRDIYRNNIDEIIVDGKESYKAAEEFMQRIAPDNKDKLKLHDKAEPLFKHYDIESKLDELYDTEVKLPSGGSIVLNPTEALVSIDVNSGKATRERSIEATALKTNIEAAQEISRQLRLRDLAGLVVIDFIDMRELRNRRNIEKALKEALKNDRARIQVGRISMFGLLEMSRQRLRSSLVESSTRACMHCKGTGVMRSDESIAIHILRAIEAEATQANTDVVIRVSPTMIAYLLNNKRGEVDDIEAKFSVSIKLVLDYAVENSSYEIEKQKGNRRDNRKPANNKKKPYKQNSADNNKGSDKKDSQKTYNKQNSSDGYKGRSDNNKQNRGKNPKSNYSSQKQAKGSSGNNIGSGGDGNSAASPQNDNIGNVASARQSTQARQNVGDSIDTLHNDSKLKGLWKRITT